MLTVPMALIAELTHLCPLRCTYCSNPLQMTARKNELTTAQWKKILSEAGELGSLQVSFTGGEPCLRKDLVELCSAAAEAKLYVNLITSGLGLTPVMLQQLRANGVEHIQLSLQDIDREGVKCITGVDALDKKAEVAGRIRESGAALTVNMVVHRQNLDRLNEMIETAVSWGALKLEIAHVQYNGWALENRRFLLPSLEQVRESVKVINAAKERYAGKVRVDFVLPDYYAKFPKPCMGGWGQKMMLIDPEGRVLPCHSASTIPNVTLPSVLENSLKEIWQESELFNLFRGTAWMPDLCRTCDRKEQDFGGCRCQALALANSAAETDPICHRSPARAVVDAAIQEARNEPTDTPIYRGSKFLEP